MGLSDGVEWTADAACERCARAFDPERADLEGWLVLDAREDGWTLIVCRACQTPDERERVRLLV